MADDYATWRPQAEQDWTDEDVERLRSERDEYRAKFERLGQAGEVYVAELRAQLACARACLEATAEFSLDATSRMHAGDALRQMEEITRQALPAATGTRKTP